jgi:hypothetical protein
MIQNHNISIFNEDFERIELFFSCRSLKASNPDTFLRLSRILENGNPYTISSTEMVSQNSNPDYTSTFELDFVFEKEQRFLVEIWNYSKSSSLIGKGHFSLGEIVGSQYNMKIINLSKNGDDMGKCIVRVDQQSQKQKYDIFMDFLVTGIPKSGMFASLNSFMKIYKRRISKVQKLQKNDKDLDYEKIPASEWLLVHQTENISNSENPDFNGIKIMGSKLSDNDFNLPLKFELMKFKKNGAHYVIGRVFCNLNELMLPNKKFEINMIKPKKEGAILSIKQFHKREIFNFIDFLEGGLNIVQLVGIDFTGSNRDPDDPQSLHFISNHGLNDYQKAIQSVGEILEKYNHNKIIPCYGFGAKYPGDAMARHLIPLTEDISQPCFKSFPDLFQGYKNIINKLLFSGPTYFAPILTEVITYARENYSINPLNYSIFLLLTDGEIQDMDETIDCIVEGSYLPLSIIIVGIGNEDFSNMDRLDGDEEGLVDSNGRPWMRDIVQFVPFNKYKGDAILLREKVLEEIPDQVTSFYEFINVKPQPQQFMIPQNNIPFGY